MKHIPSRGDIFRIEVNPGEGKAKGKTYQTVLIVSADAYNQLGVVTAAPITEGNPARFAGFAVSLEGTKTGGTCLVNHARMLDLEARHALLIEQAPAAVVDDAMDRLRLIYE